MSINYTKIQLRRNKADATDIDTYRPLVGEPVFSTYNTGNKLIIGDRSYADVNEMVSANKYFPEMVEILGLYAGDIQLSKSPKSQLNASFNKINCAQINCPNISNVQNLGVDTISTNNISPKADSILIGENNLDTFKDYIKVSSDGIDVTAHNGRNGISLDSAIIHINTPSDVLGSTIQFDENNYIVCRGGDIYCKIRNSSNGYTYGKLCLSLTNTLMIDPNS